EAVAEDKGHYSTNEYLILEEAEVYLRIGKLNGYHSGYTDHLLYLCVVAGGKHLDRVRFIRVLARFAPCLEDACFFVQDELYHNVAYRITGGRLQCQEWWEAEMSEEMEGRWIEALTFVERK